MEAVTANNRDLYPIFIGTCTNSTLKVNTKCKYICLINACGLRLSCLNRQAFSNFHGQSPWKCEKKWPYQGFISSRFWRPHVPHGLDFDWTDSRMLFKTLSQLLALICSLGSLFSDHFFFIRSIYPTVAKCNQYTKLFIKLLNVASLMLPMYWSVPISKFT